jgi:hypothetical protein
VIVGRDNLDLGELVRDITRETVRAVFAVEGDITSGLQYEVSYVFGHTTETNITTGDRINERFFAAIDAVRDPATNNIVCRSDLNPNAVPLGNYPGFGSTTQNPDTFGTTFTPGRNSGCVPINIFGQNISEAGRAWINNVSREKANIEQHVLTGFVTGDTERFFSFPTGGPLAFVLGGEYRKEKSETEPDRLAALSAEIDEDLTWLGQSTAVRGKFDVKEVFAELSAPGYPRPPVLPGGHPHRGLQVLRLLDDGRDGDVERRGAVADESLADVPLHQGPRGPGAEHLRAVPAAGPDVRPAGGPLRPRQPGPRPRPGQAPGELHRRPGAARTDAADLRRHLVVGGPGHRRRQPQPAA